MLPLPHQYSRRWLAGPLVRYLRFFTKNSGEWGYNRCKRFDYGTTAKSVRKMLQTHASGAKVATACNRMDLVVRTSSDYCEHYIHNTPITLDLQQFCDTTMQQKFYTFTSYRWLSARLHSFIANAMEILHLCPKPSQWFFSMSLASASVTRTTIVSILSEYLGPSLVLVLHRMFIALNINTILFNVFMCIRHVWI